MTIYGTLKKNEITLNNGESFERRDNEMLPDFLIRVMDIVTEKHNAKLILSV